MTAFVGAAMKELVEKDMTLVPDMAPQVNNANSSLIKQPLGRGPLPSEAAEYSDSRLENIV